MKNFQMFFLVVIALVASACALDNDTPTPTKEITTVAPPKGDVQTANEPSTGKIPSVLPAGAIAIAPKLRIVSTHNLGFVWGHVGIAGSKDGFLVVRKEAEDLQLSASSIQTDGSLWRPTALLPYSILGHYSVAARADGGYLVGSGHVVDHTIYPYLSEVSGSGDLDSSERFDDGYPVIKTIDGKTYVVGLVDDWDGIAGKISVSVHDGKKLTPFTVLAVNRPDTETSMTIEDFTVLDGNFTFGINWYPSAGPTSGSLLVQDGMSVHEVKYHSLDPKKEVYRFQTRKTLTLGGKNLVAWRFDEMPSVQDYLTVVTKDGTLGYTYKIPEMTDAALVGDQLVVTTFNFAAGSATLKILDSDTAEVTSVSIGATSVDWLLRLAIGGDGHTIGITWKDRATENLMFSIAEYR